MNSRYNLRIEFCRDMLNELYSTGMENLSETGKKLKEFGASSSKTAALVVMVPYASSTAERIDKMHSSYVAEPGGFYDCCRDHFENLGAQIVGTGAGIAAHIGLIDLYVHAIRHYHLDNNPLRAAAVPLAAFVLTNTASGVVEAVRRSYSQAKKESKRRALKRK